MNRLLGAKKRLKLIRSLEMDESEVRIPVRCPECGTVTLTAFPSVVVAIALTSWHQMHLYSHCHEASWDATQSEMGSIREHLGEDWLLCQGLERFILIPPYAGRTRPCSSIKAGWQLD
jgi:hypothetical protein